MNFSDVLRNTPTDFLINSLTTKKSFSMSHHIVTDTHSGKLLLLMPNSKSGTSSSVNLIAVSIASNLFPEMYFVIRYGAPLNSVAGSIDHQSWRIGNSFKATNQKIHTQPDIKTASSLPGYFCSFEGCEPLLQKQTHPYLPPLTNS